MKVFDYEIGDWVFFVGAGEVKLGRVEGIVQDGSRRFILYQGVWYKASSVEPVQITGYALQNNCFIPELMGDKYDYSLTEECGRKIIVSSNQQWLVTDNKWGLQVKGTDDEMSGICELTYIHELQHALKLFESPVTIDTLQPSSVLWPKPGDNK